MSYSTAGVDGPAPSAGVRPPPTLSIVVPCHNEADGLPALFAHLERLNDDMLTRGLIPRPVQLILVDDGSRDATWDAIRHAHTTLPLTGVRLSRNHGHQSALLAGLTQVTTDAAVSMDADLQDDPEAVIPMVEAYLNGAEIVYGVRGTRDVDTWFKRNSARLYYKAMRALDVDLIPDHADFRLMSRKALSALAEFDETNLFLRGLIRKLGFASETVTYDRGLRTTGQSSYPIGKMIALGIEGVTSLSVRPLRLITVFGFAVAAMAMLFSLYSLVVWANGQTVPGWTSIVLPLSFLGGAHLIALGIIGEYIGKIYRETKRRPRFIIDELVHTDPRAHAERGKGANSAKVPR